MIDYEFNITIEKGSGGINNPVLHVVVTESHITEYWGGLTEVNYVERVMAPNQNGTVLDFSGSNIQEVAISLMIEQEWVNEECELVVFLQNNSNKEILQAVKYDIMEFGTTSVNDASILKVYVPKPLCNETITPKVRIANYGLDNLTSLDLSVYFNDDMVSSMQWTGDLEYLESELIEFPEMTVVIEPSNSFEIIAENPNGEEDEYPSNNIYSVNIGSAPNVAGTVSLVLNKGENPEEITWELLDSQGNVEYSGGPYTSSPPVVIESFDLVDPDCYSFIIYDEGGDGLAGGNYVLGYSNPPIYIGEGSDFGMEDHVQFGFGLTGTQEITIEGQMKVYPNPTTQNTTVSFELLEAQTVEMQVFNSMGALVQNVEAKQFGSGSHSFEIYGEELNAGVYYINLRVGEKIEVQKLIIK
jgi:hypothetical protein